MKRFRPILSLVFVGLLAAIFWRLEVEWHGWEGLIWIGYFRWAIPVGAVLFAAWIAVFAPITPKQKRLIFAQVFLLFSVAAYLITGWALSARYGMIILGPPPSRINLWFWQNAIFAVMPLVPAAYLILARLCGAPITFHRTALCLGLYTLSFPAAILLLGLVNHRGGPDMIHAIKSGFVIPFLIVSLGTPLILPNQTKPASLRP